MCESSILEVFSNYDIADVFTSRAQIVSDIEVKIKSYFEQINMTFKAVSIINMDLPEKFNDEVLNTQIALQGIDEKTNLKAGI